MSEVRQRAAGLSASMRNDGYANTLSGLGVAPSRSGSNKYDATAVSMTQGELLGLYDNHWLARRVVDIYPDQALRRPLVAAAGSLDAFNAINISPRYPQGALKHGLKMGRLCGGSAIVIGSVGSGAGLAEPLPAGAGTVDFLEVVTKFDLVTDTRYRSDDPDPLRAGRSATFKVFSGRLKGLIIHESRLIICEGETRATWSLQQQDIDFPWQSSLQVVNEVLGSYGISWVAVGHLIQESSMAWLRLNGLVDMLTQEDKSVVTARQELLSTGRNVARTVFLDAGNADANAEEFGRTSVSFSDLPNLLAEFRHEVAGGTGIPEPVLFKQSLSSGAGETDMRQFYDGVGEYRDNSVKPKLNQILELVHIAPKVYSFPSLWEPTDTQAADIRVKQAGGDQVMFTIGALTAAQILRSRHDDGTLGVKIDDIDAAVKAVEEREKKDAELADAERAAGASGQNGPFGSDRAKQASETGGPNAGSVPARPGANNIPADS